MKIATEVKQRIKYLRYGKIFTYDLFDDIKNRQALYTALSRLVKEKKIAQFAKGKFYKVKKYIEKYGKNNGKSFEYYSSVDNKSRWEEFLGKDGLVIGGKLYNSLGLTTQNTFIVEIATPSISPKNIKIESTRIKYSNLPISANKNNKKIIELIEVVANKRKILDLIDNEFTLFINKTLKNINFKLLKQVFLKYPLYKRKDFIKNISKEDKNVAEMMLKTLKPYQRYNYEFA